jgi:MurNAc alpha-1-phosphate uridylyltransferase
MSFPVMLFAAGFGTRMKHLTADKPKPMVTVAGRPLIDHALALAEDIAPEVIVANLHYLPEMLISHLGSRNVKTIIEMPEILETGGGLRNALPLLGAGPVITMNTDAIWQGPNPLRLLLDAWEPSYMDALLMCVPPSRALEHTGAGDFVRAKDGQLTRGTGGVFGGVQIIKTGLLAEIEEEAFSLNLIWDRMLEAQTLYGLEYSGKWCDVGHPGGVTTAEGMLDSDV